MEIEPSQQVLTPKLLKQQIENEQQEYYIRKRILEERNKTLKKQAMLIRRDPQHFQNKFFKSQVFTQVISEGKDLILQYMKKNKKLADIVQELDNRMELRSESQSKLFQKQQAKKTALINQLKQLEKKLNEMDLGSK